MTPLLGPQYLNNLCFKILAIKPLNFLFPQLKSIKFLYILSLDCNLRYQGRGNHVGFLGHLSHSDDLLLWVGVSKILMMCINIQHIEGVMMLLSSAIVDLFIL